MKQNSHCSIRRCVIGVAACALLLSMVVGPSWGDDSVTIAPSMIILNVKGQCDSVQATIRQAMPSGYTLTDFEVNLWMDGTVVAQAYALRYCYVDDNFLASFDREEVQNNPVVVGLADSVVTATIQGWYTAVAADGETTITRPFLGSDLVEIRDPGKK